ncbi:adenosine kinase [Bosea psychrotolerans]|uniref:Sugar/nucleoside kinase (Ribokinase family) n=1 Tax=Bosea psychrotolerans TaxID=1871628 RepID=A0A2S4LSV2_9HYPH|nr:adenosine kinase [Bosea psychrotolerans]POR45485.1 sugar/nucleoside kinase (ribokinase family) [Bosea psychrotolerans]
MSHSRTDVLALGNAIVDVIASAEEDFLAQHDLAKGAMMLIDEARAEALYAAMGPGKVISGGSAANTIAGLASFGGKGAFIGKVKADELGKIYRHDLTSLGVSFDTAFATDGPATARSFIIVTPDGERTMNTYLGACQGLTVGDVDAKAVENADIIYLEGYLWDPPAAKEAFRKASEIAHKAGGRVAITLSDSFCVDRYRDEFLGLIRNRMVDIVFANEHELKSLYQTADFETALAALRAENILAAVTRSEKGALAVTPDGIVAEPVFPVERIVDSTGAGDLFAAGFLFGLTSGREVRDALRLGALAAAEVISHVGARPDMNLKVLAGNEGLL